MGDEELVEFRFTDAEVERLTQSAAEGVAMAFAISLAKREVAHCALARAKQEARQGDVLVDALVGALEVVLTLGRPAGSAAEGRGRFADGRDYGWKKALDRARAVVALKLNELPEDTAPTKRALFQVFDELARAESAGYQAYNLPTKLDRHNPRRSRPRVQRMEPKNMREAILAALPNTGDEMLRGDVKKMLEKKGLAASPSSADNAIKRLVDEGALGFRRQHGGGVLVRL